MNQQQPLAPEHKVENQEQEVGLVTAKGRFRDKTEEQTIEIALLILRCKFEQRGTFLHIEMKMIKFQNLNASTIYRSKQMKFEFYDFEKELFQRRFPNIFAISIVIHVVPTSSPSSAQ